MVTGIRRFCLYGCLPAIVLIAADVIFGLGMYDRPETWRDLAIASFAIGVVAALCMPFLVQIGRLVEMRLNTKE